MNLLEKIAALENEATEFGFQWETTDQIMTQIQSECIGVDDHLKAGINDNSSALQEEIGDLLHAVFSLCVFCKLDLKDTLQQTVEKFERRLRAVKMIAHEMKLINLEGQTFDELMSIWKQAKSRVG